MRLTNLALAISAVCIPAAVLVAQTPATTNLSFAAFQPYQNGKIVYKIWVDVYTQTQQSPNDLGPGNPPPSDPGPGPGHGNLPQKPFIQYMTPEQYAAGTGNVLHPIDMTPDDPPCGGDLGGPPPTPLPPNKTLELLADTCYHCSPRGLFSPRVITEQQVLANGVAQSQIDSVKSTQGMTKVVFKESSISIDGVRNNYDRHQKSSNFAKTHIAKGIVTLSVTIPHSGRWAIKVTDALANERVYALTLGQGLHTIIVTDVEAGNTLVALYEMQPDGQGTTYFQEAYALVRKNEVAEISMVFRKDDSPYRYRIGHLGIGQNSQSVREVVPLQGDREAMVRVMVYDSYGQGEKASQPFPVQVSWSLPGGQTQTLDFMSHISGHHTASGRLCGVTGPFTLGPKIPAADIQPGLQISAKLLDPDTSDVLHQVGPIPVQVVSPRTIRLDGYEVKPPWGSGVPVANSYFMWNDEIMPFTRDAFPYATIDYRRVGKLWLPIFGHGAHNHVVVMTFMNILAGWLPTDFLDGSWSNLWGNHDYRLNLGIINDRYSNSETKGMCWYWRPGISLAAEHGRPYQDVAYTLAHEMCHAFGLEHAPSEGADGYVGPLHTNRVDYDYPYGGESMAGGWGYADIWHKEIGGSVFKNVKHFLSEDAHTVENPSMAHWDLMAYLHDSRTFINNRLSDYNQRKMLNAMKLNLPNPVSYSQEPDDQFANLPVIPGTNVKVFGPEQAHAVEEAWYREHGVKSIHAVNPAQMDSTPLDFDTSAITVTGDGRFIMPRLDPGDVIVPAEFAHLVEGAPEGDSGDMIHLQGNGDGHVGLGNDDDDDDEPPYMIVTRLPRLLGLNVEQ